MKGQFYAFTKAILALACLMPGTLVAQAAKVTPLFSKDLTNLPGKEGLMVTVEYPPASSYPIHRHNAHRFIYVLEGSIVMQHASDFFRLLPTKENLSQLVDPARGA
jgi:hypothetical protein